MGVQELACIICVIKRSFVGTYSDFSFFRPYFFFIDSAISVVFYNEELEKVVKRFMHNSLFEGK